MSEEQQQELSLEELDRQEQQAYAETLASRNEARTEEVPTQELAKEEAQPQEQAPAEQQPEPEPEKPIFAGLTETELKARLARIDELDQLRSELATETRKVYGKVGELNGELKQLRELQKHHGALSPEALNRLKEDYPDLAEILSVGAGDAPEVRSKPEDVEKLVSERVQAAITETTDRLEQKLISIQHKDWKEIPKTEEFKVWFGSLPKDRAEALWNSRDGDHVVSEITEFKAWRETYRKQQADAQEAERQKQDKQARLEAAAQPSGVAPAAQKAIASEEEAYAQARADAARLRRRR